MKKLIITIIAVICIQHFYAQNIFTVTKTTDPDPFEHPYDNDDQLCDPDMYGTLQWAVRKTNDATGNCTINFNISGSGPHTILLNNYLPTINNTVTIDGTTQPGYTFQNPAVIIDGQNNIVQLINLYGSDNSVVNGLYIKNVTTYGVSGSYSDGLVVENCVINQIDNGTSTTFTAGIIINNSENCLIKGNIIGTDANITVPGIEDIGIMLWLNANNNIIGGSGLNDYNIVTQCGIRGVWIGSQSVNNLITRNLIYDNPEGIVTNGGGNNQKTPPVISFYDAAYILSGTSLANDIIEIFGSTDQENANEFITSVTTDASGNWSANVTTTYDYFIANIL